jgi:predicted permease
MLVKNPAVTAIAVLTLALGIGANTAIFSTLNSLMLRPLAVENADRLTVIMAQHQGEKELSLFSYLDFSDLRTQMDGFSSVLAYNLNLLGLYADGKSEPIAISFVSGNYFQALGLKPAAGQLIYGEGTEKPGTEPVIVLGHTYWKKRFNADPGVVGKQVKLNGHGATIVGVAPESFHGLYSIVDMQAYVPMGVRKMLRDPDDKEADDFWNKRDNRRLLVFGIRKPGISIKQAQTSANVVMERLANQYPDPDKGVTARLFPETLARPEPDPSNGIVVVGVLFMALAGMVLLLACSNVANILLVRATTREREMAVRAALGAGRTRLVRQLLTESLLLAILGGLAGLGLGHWVSKMLSSIRLEALIIPIRFDFSFDWRVFVFALGAALVTALFVGLAPAWRASRTDLNRVLHEGSRGILAGTGRSWFRNSLVAGQVAVSLVLLVVAGLFLRSARNAEHVYLGFNPAHILNLSMDTQNIGFGKERSRQFYRDLKDRVRVLPGVVTVSTTSSVPMGYVSSSNRIFPEGSTSTEAERGREIQYESVDPAFFETMRIPLIRGRFFTEDDKEKTSRVAVVNEEMARELWPKQDPIGKRFRAKTADAEPVEIVGVTKQGKYTGPAEDPKPFFYVPQAQEPTEYRVLQVRTSGNPETLISVVRQQIHALAPELPVFGVESMEKTLEGGNGLFIFRIATKLTGALGALGLILALVGVYGVISYAAAQRTHEIGVRMAMGADRNDILKMVLRRGMVLVGVGVAIGLVITFAATRGISSLLVDVSPSDPLTLALVALLLGGVGMLASFIPARRAMRVEPLKALKYE